MASKLVLPQLSLARRQMANVASKASDAAARSHKIETSLLPSGLRVASLDSDSAALSTVGVLVKAGSCYETPDILGTSQAMRLSVGLTCGKASSFGIVRNLQQIGATINVVGSREYLLYTLIAPRDIFSDCFDVFNEVVTGPEFRPWELSEEVHSRLLDEVYGLQNHTLAVELLHKAAFRHGLGNSLYAPKFMAGNHKTAMLKGFHEKTHTITRTVVAGSGIDHSTLSRLGNSLALDKGHGPTESNQYFGGEMREECGGNLTSIAIAGQSCGLSNAREAMSFALLKNVLGTGSGIKRGNLNGKLGKAVAKIEGEKAVGGINAAYQDTGLCGALITCQASIARQVAGEVLAALKNVSVSDEELQAAKKAYTMDHAESMLSAQSLVENLALDTLSGSEMDVSELLSTISTGDLNAAAKKLASGKLSMSAVGNLKTLPYLDTM